MANPYQITIVLPDNNGEGAIAGQDDKVYGGGKSNGKDSSLAAATKISGMIFSWDNATQLADRVISHQIGTVSLRTGNQERQQRIETVYSELKSAGGATLAIGGGFVAGGVGGAAVAAVGVALSYLNKLISYGQRQDQLNLAATVEGISLAQLNLRAGTQGRRDI